MMEEYKAMHNAALSLLVVICIIFLITGIIWSYHYINGEKKVCKKEFVGVSCYKVECYFISCSKIKIDCESSSVELKKDIYENKCEWIKKK